MRLAGFGVGVLLSSGALTGCYSLRPVTTPLLERSDVAFDINDAGRVALGEQVGPEVAQLEGRLLDTENGDYLLSVRTVRFLRGGEQIWSGERVRVSQDHVRTVYERRFSPGRTAAMAAVTVGGVVAFLATRNLLGVGREPPNPDPDPDPGNSLTRPTAGPRP